MTWLLGRWYGTCRVCRSLLAVLALGMLWLSAVAGEVPVLVELEGECLADWALRPSRAGVGLSGVAPVGEVMARIEAQQAVVVRQLESIGGRVMGRITRVANVLAARIPEEQWDVVASWPGVVRVEADGEWVRALETSVPFVGVPPVWSPTAGGWTGEGIRIGIIDSGIDYLHADFGGSGSVASYAANNAKIIESGTFPTAKVVGGYDLVGDDYDFGGSGSATIPVPDPDPLDPEANGHGTHVAGVAAGFGVLTNGATYSGPYDAALEFGRFQIGPGVAPRAQLYALKVFGRTGTTAGSVVVQALDRAADPNQDGDFADRLDVVNLSLGYAFGSSAPTDIWVSAVRRISALGCVVCGAAGNAGNTHFVVGGPAQAPQAISVANSIDDGAAFSTIRVNAPEAIAGEYAAEEAEFTPALWVVGPVTAPLVMADPLAACQGLGNAAVVAGKLVLIDRGGCYFADKVRNAMQAGAVGVVVVNNVDGPPIIMGGAGDVSDLTIPAVMISLADGDLLKAYLELGVEVTLSASEATARPELADQLDESSSRGPAMPDLYLKPELTAPGTSIRSALAGGGAEGSTISGTSVSSPHVAGAVALLRQAHADWPVEDLKAALMNTAVGTHTGKGVPMPESRAGAGRLSVAAALGTEVVAGGHSTNGVVACSFGALELAEVYRTNRELRVANHGAEAAVFEVAISNTVVETGVTLRSRATSITVPGRGSVLVPIELEVDPTRFDRQGDLSTPARLGQWPRQTMFEASGQVWFRNPGRSLHVPWYVLVRALSGARVAATNVGLAADAVSTLSLPTRGPSAHGAPLVSAFELGAISPEVGFQDERAAADLVAMGAASDFARVGSLDECRLYFGLAVAGRWWTPQRALLALDVEIDLDGDGNADAALLNATGDGLVRGEVEDRGYMNDALITVVRRGAAGSTNYVAGGVLNVLEPAFRDTAPYQNSVLVHTASAAVLGLSAGHTAFRYRAVTRGSYHEETQWARFDAARPAVDATAFGLNGTPFFDEGNSVKIRVDRAAAAAAGYGGAVPPRVLLLHQHQALGRQVEIVTLRLETADADADGLADAAELEWLGDLDADATTDRDRDGARDGEELLAGTDPLSAASYLRMVVGVGQAGGALGWTSVAGRSYALERAGNVAGPYTTVQTGLTATEPLNQFTDTTAVGPGPFYYRIRVE